MTSRIFAHCLLRLRCRKQCKSSEKWIWRQNNQQFYFSFFYIMEKKMNLHIFYTNKLMKIIEKGWRVNFFPSSSSNVIWNFSDRLLCHSACIPTKIFNFESEFKLKFNLNSLHSFPDKLNRKAKFPVLPSSILRSSCMIDFNRREIFPQMNIFRRPHSSSGAIKKLRFPSATAAADGVVS